MAHEPDAGACRWTAGNGTPLLLRQVRADDGERLRRSLALLSPEARRQRLLGGATGFSEDFVEGLTASDPTRQFAVIVVREEAGEEIPVAGGRLVVDDILTAAGTPLSCEFALTVGDRWQGQGIGQQILYALIAEARRRKLSTMAGDILADNRAMLALARQTGFFVEDVAGDGTLRATLDLNSLVVTQTLKDRRFTAVEQPPAPAPTPAARSSTPLAPPLVVPATWQATLLCAGLAMLGLLLAMLAVWFGTGWLDGFDYRHTNRLGRRFLRSLPWALPLAAVGGLLLYTYFRWALTETHKGWVTLLAIVRAFALFPLLGFAMLFGMIFSILAAIPLALHRRFLRRGKTGDDEEGQGLLERTLVVPLWILTLPFTLLKVQSDGDIEIPARLSWKRLLRWLPIFFLMLLAGPGFESESTGDRVDPNWLTAIAAWWLADLLIVTGYVAPTLAEHARARRIERLAGRH